VDILNQNWSNDSSWQQKQKKINLEKQLEWNKQIRRKPSNLWHELDQQPGINSRKYWNRLWRLQNLHQASQAYRNKRRYKITIVLLEQQIQKRHGSNWLSINWKNREIFQHQKQKINRQLKHVQRVQSKLLHFRKRNLPESWQCKEDREKPNRSPIHRWTLQKKLIKRSWRQKKHRPQLLERSNRSSQLWKWSLLQNLGRRVQGSDWRIPRRIKNQHAGLLQNEVQHHHYKTQTAFTQSWEQKGQDINSTCPLIVPYDWYSWGFWWIQKEKDFWTNYFRRENQTKRNHVCYGLTQKDWRLWLTQKNWYWTQQKDALNER
jgi:hypothetical protein